MTHAPSWARAPAPATSAASSGANSLGSKVGIKDRKNIEKTLDEEYSRLR